MSTTVWNNPNYTGELFMVGRNRTPFLNMMGGLNGGLTVAAMDFPVASTYSLDAASQPAITETASETVAAYSNYTRNQELNTCQIYQEAINVTYSKLSTPAAILTDLSNGLAAAGTNVVQNEVDFQIQAALKQIAVDFNYTCINGAYVQATASNVAAKTKGMVSAITTTVVSGVGTLAKADIDSAMAGIAAAGGPLDEPVAFCHSSEKIALSNLYSSSMSLAPRDRNVGGVNITMIVTDFGNLGVVWDPDVPDGTIVIADMAHVRPVFCPVPDKGLLFYEELARTGAAVKGQIYGQMGLDFGPEDYHGKLTGVT